MHIIGNASLFLQFTYVPSLDTCLPVSISMRICSVKLKKATDGSKYVQVTCLKYKLREDVFREIKCPPTYGKCHFHKA